MDDPEVAWAIEKEGDNRQMLLRRPLQRGPAFQRARRNQRQLQHLLRRMQEDDRRRRKGHRALLGTEQIAQGEEEWRRLNRRRVRLP